MACLIISSKGASRPLLESTHFRNYARPEGTSSCDVTHTSSHPIVDLSNDCYHLRMMYSNPNECLPQKGAVDNVITFLAINAAHEE